MLYLSLSSLVFQVRSLLVVTVNEGEMVRLHVVSAGLEWKMLSGSCKMMEALLIVCGKAKRGRFIVWLAWHSAI